MIRTTAAALSLAVVTWPAAAEVAEMRLGVMAHDVGFLGHHKEGGVDLNAEMLSSTPSWLKPVGAPRPHLGFAINSQGDTSQIYAGLTWTITPVEPFFIDFSLGGAVHDGKLDSAETDRKSLGSRVLFRESVALGMRIGNRQNLSLFFDHESNANLARHNEGLNNLGLRWGYQF